ncbi:leucine rich repeat domain containing [Trichoderma arundinaceum]|uniref:Leucine rich repeat domain containing n=1 Tax=Trichoderma arundinaceum TaxID=490622 RepID=A0A395N7K6_TRIAR|nr:leucine rich repeat domain containing [Trichoderma arundinaceum]
MMADALPSYQDAVSRSDWLQLAAPYMAYTDYPALCRVNRRWWCCKVAALIRNRLPADTISWWIEFIHHKLGVLTTQTRALIRVLDARGAAGSNDFSLYMGLRESAFERALGLLPNVESLLLEDHVNLDVGFLRRVPGNLAGFLRMLSLKNCPNGVSSALSSISFTSVVYLDVSGTFGAQLKFLTKERLPDLRILKLRRNGIDTEKLALWESHMGRRLWSIDLSENISTDGALRVLATDWFPPSVVLRSDDHAQVEGVLIKTPIVSSYYGYFNILREPPYRDGESLPIERYLVDAPTYRARNEPWRPSRSDGSVSIRSDTAEGVLRLLSRNDGNIATDHLPGSTGITHLHLSGNQLSAVAVERMLRLSNGQLELFDCDSTRLYPPPLSAHPIRLSRITQMYGFLGMEHVFRPVWSSNLRSLRIHHSLVTNIPTLEIQGHHTIECIFLAENQVLPRLDLAYPLAFLPDANPRLESLTLTCVPRHSFGPLIQKLVSFLRLLGRQEQDLADTNKAAALAPGRPLRFISGLRHLALEIEPSALEPLELDAGELMADGDNTFSFFDGPDERKSAPSPPCVHLWSYPTTDLTAPGLESMPPWTAYNPAQLSDPDRDYGKEHWISCRPDGPESRQIMLWAGNPESHNPVIRVYYRLVSEFGELRGLGPVNPSQTRAGAPKECIISHHAWFIASLPHHVQSLPLASIREMGVIEDVAAVLRHYRIPKADDFTRIRERVANSSYWCWNGTLEVIDAKSSHEDLNLAGRRYDVCS